MGVISYFYETEPECLSPAVVGLLGQFLPKKVLDKGLKEEELFT
jgi:hypothetical protein